MALADAVERRIAVFLAIRSRHQIKIGANFAEIFPCQSLDLVLLSLNKSPLILDKISSVNGGGFNSKLFYNRSILVICLQGSYSYKYSKRFY